MSSGTDNCCDGDVYYNPKKDRGARHGRGFMVFNSMQNPIPGEVADSSELKKFFEKWPFIPFAGNNKESGHSLLVFYEMLRKMSPTNGACMNKKATFAFGTAATTIWSENPEFDIGEEREPPSIAEKSRYQDVFFEQIMFETPLQELARQLSVEFESNGNAWLELVVAKEGGQSRGLIRRHRQVHVMYLNTPPDTPEAVGISPIWTDEYLNRNPPRMVTRYPVWTSAPDGTMRTMFHLKNGDNTWYGRPKSESATLNKFSEVQATFYRLRSVYGEFTGKIIIETEDSNPIQTAEINNSAAQDAGFDDYVDRFRENFTNVGNDPLGFHVVSRPYGAKPMFVFALPPNQNHYYFRGIGALDEDMILRAHESTRRFMSFSAEGGSGLSHTAFIEDYTMHMEPVINSLRRTVMVFLNEAISAYWTKAGLLEMDEQSLWFGSPIDSTIADFKQSLFMGSNTGT
ncbi:MAG: hypothetical protein KDC70_01175 [Saprospiraceae bacterium]|nr:hypothetical protein [Saprospiraceae bacterium]